MSDVDRKLNAEGGYTLTEMLVVIGIIGLIAAVLTPTLMGHLSRARTKAAELQLKSTLSAVELFREDVGRYPTTAEGLAVLVKEPAGVEGWTGPYLEGPSSLNDPWGRPIIYALGRHVSVKSLGADGEPGGSSADRDLEVPARAQ